MSMTRNILRGLRISISILFSGLILGLAGAFAPIGGAIALLIALGYVFPYVFGVAEMGLLFLFFAPIVKGTVSFAAMFSAIFLTPSFLCVVSPSIGLGFLAGAVYGIYCGAFHGVAQFKDSFYAGLQFPLIVVKSFWKERIPFPDIMTRQELEEVVEVGSMQRIINQMKKDVSEHGIEFFHVFLKNVPLPYDPAKTVIEYAINSNTIISTPYYLPDFPTAAFNIKQLSRIHPITHIVRFSYNTSEVICWDIAQSAKDKRSDERARLVDVDFSFLSASQETKMIDQLDLNTLSLVEKSDGTTKMIWKMFGKRAEHILQTTDTMVAEMIEDAVDDMMVLMKKSETDQPKVHTKNKLISLNERRANALVLSWIGTAIDSQIVELEKEQANPSKARVEVKHSPR